MKIFIIILSLNFEINAKYVSHPPSIDGYIEEVWHSADSITEFVQQFPDEGKPATYPTTLYVLYTENAIYFAFKCKQEDVYAEIDLWDRGSGDGVGIYLDTFLDKKTAYYFYVNAKGIQSDGIISEDGREKDLSWDGIWNAVSRIYRWGYVVEIEIPFKTIKYGKGLFEWGCNFYRFIYRNAESSYWVPVKRNEGLRVSQFGTLKGIKPGVKGRFFEVYPVGLLKYDRIIHETPETRPKAGLDVAWNPTSQISFNATFFPDFGEIEADPYVLNLSKYATYYTDRRPFFIEGTEFFRVPPQGDFNIIGQPYELFYTRRIGKKLVSGKEVPISAGTKFLSKTKDFEMGFILARCERTEDEYETEPLSYFQILRLKKHLFGNSDIGFIYAGKDEIKPYDYERAFGFDLNLRDVQNDAKVIFARSYEKQKGDFLLDFRFLHMGKNFVLIGGAQNIGNSFDLNDVGYVPSYGTKGVVMAAGPQIYPKNYIYRLFFLIAQAWLKEYGEKDFSSAWSSNWEITFKNWWGLNGNVNVGKEFEQDNYYHFINYNGGFHTDWRKPLHGGMWSGRYFGYYECGEYIPSYVYWGDIYLGYEPISSMGIGLDLNTSVLTEEEKIKNYYFITRPRFSWNISKDLKISLYTEGVYNDENRRFIRFRFGGILSFMIAPKSWFYIAINDLEGYEEKRYLPYERIYIAKLRYLFYF